MFSFFCHMPCGGAEIRGKQMAARLNGRYNPKQDFAEDTCVYLLGTIPPEEPAVAYHDILDAGLARIATVCRDTRGPLLAVSTAQVEWLRKHYPTRQHHLIPQHHCNFDRVQRPARPVQVVGCLGGYTAIQWPSHGMQRMVGDLGLEWRFQDNVKSREAVVAYYQTIDIQIVFRPTAMRHAEMVWHRNPLKLSNAGSFGIPTVAYPEPAFVQEWAGACVFADTMDKIMREVKRLKDNPSWYAEMADRARLRAAQYHIDHIAGLYEALPHA